MHADTHPPQDPWIITETDDILLTYPYASPGQLADDMERKPETYDQGLDASRAVIAELRKRENSGVRFWPNDEDESDAFGDGPGKLGRIMVWRDDAPQQIECRWGFKPVEPGGRPVSLLRWEGRLIDSPCLIIANDFGLKVDGAYKYRASLITGAPFFCLAGVYRPGTRDWPESYAALTTEAYPDIAPYKDRHVAVVREEDWFDWLRLSRPVEELLRPFPPGSFKVVGTGKPKASGNLFDFG